MLIAPPDRRHRDEPFISVAPLDAAAWTVQGWAWGYEVIDRPDYWTGDPAHPLFGRIPFDAWACPVADLRDLRELPPDRLRE
jgi:hypothetical protein